jgi:DDE superfamily endonuclease
MITTPDGMLFHVFGPFEGRRHGMHFYFESGLDSILGERMLIEGVQYYIYGDSGYMLRPYVISPFSGVNLTAEQALFNKRLSRARVSVEQAFKGVKKYFSHIAFPRKMLLSKTPAGSRYLAS